MFFMKIFNYPLRFPFRVTWIKSFSLLLGMLLFLSCDENVATSNKSDKESQKKIIQDYVYDCAQHHNYRYEMHKWQECLDKGLEKDSTIAYLWQQKAMPLFKARKYEAGMVFLDKAVKYDEKGWLAYRGFIKCIFAKTYREAIKDFEKIKEIEGNSFVMDHTYNFHIALSYLQLNEFEKAEQIFKKDIEKEVKKWGEDGYHHLDLFYYGISLFEQQKWEEAMVQFDKSLEIYPKFCEPMLYKGLTMMQLEDYSDEEIGAVLEKAKENKDAGNTINEDNAIYETYPYQIGK